MALAVLIVIYGVLSIRYFPGNMGKTVVETLIHIFSVAPVNLGATLVIVSVIQKILRERLPLERVLRIFFTVALCLELLLGLAHYFQGGGSGITG